MKIVFFGTSDFAVPILEALIDASFLPMAVVTAPDKPAGRGKKLAISPVKKFLQEQYNVGAELLQPEKIDSKFVLRISNLRPSLGVVASYGKILPKAILEIFPKGILNVHPSLLPKHRGPSPIQAAILNGDEKTGVTIMLVDEKMDHGPILSQTEFDDPNSVWNFKELHDKLAKLGAKLLIKTLPKWMNGEITSVLQDELKATYTKMLKKENGLIDWSKSPEYIERMVRAYNPWPGSYTETKNKKLKIKKVEIVDGKIKPLIVQLEGKKEMTYEEFLRGHPDFSLAAGLGFEPR